MTLASLQLGMHWFPERAGGLDRVYYELAQALPAAGVSFTGLVAGSGRAAAETHGAVRAFAAVSAHLPARLLGMRWAFSETVKGCPPDLVVSHFALYTLPILRMLKAPLVLHFQGPWADEGVLEGDSKSQHAIKRCVERLVYRRAARAIVLSRAFAMILARGYGFPRDRIDVIPGGVDVRRFAIAATRESARARLGWPADRVIVVAVRRLAPRMGLEALIAAVVTLRKDIPELLLLIAGRGALQSRLAAQIDALGLSGHARLIGFVSDEDLALMYRAADLSVVPSTALEGFGLVAAESLAAGTPCLVSPVGGLPEVVSGLSPDLVLASAAPASIAQGLRAALRGETNLPGADACRDYAARLFAWPVVAAKVAESYRTALR